MAQADACAHPAPFCIARMKSRAVGHRRCATYFLTAALASSADLPPSLAQVPLATYFHSSAPFSALLWPAHECVPERLAQSFWPALAMPKHFSLPAALS